MKINEKKICKENEHKQIFLNINQAFNEDKIKKLSRNNMNSNIFHKDLNAIISSQSISNLSRLKSSFYPKNNNLKKFSEEKSSERNVLDDFIHNSEKNLKIVINGIKNNDLISSHNNSYEINGDKIDYLNKNIFSDNIFNIKKLKNKNIDIKKKSKDNIRENINKNLVKDLKCLFCGVSSSNEKYNNLFTCQHFFCQNCGKNFFEEVLYTLIKSKNFKSNLKCPIIKCENIIPLPLLKIILSEEYYNYLENFQQKNRKNIKNLFYNFETDYILQNSRIKKERIKNNKNNLININNKNKFIYYIKKTFIQCIICKEYSLYGNVDGKYDLCLNCLSKYCKFCHKLFEIRHFEKTYINHCRVIYRTNKDYSKCRYVRRYIYFLMYIVAGYLYLLSYFLIKIKEIPKINSNLIKVLKLIYYLALFILFLPLVLLIFPYFPIITSL